MLQIVPLVCHAQCDSCNDIPAAKFWEGDVDADWNDANNWSGNTLPTTESVTVDGDLYTNAPIISVNSTFSPADVFVIDGATLTLQANLTLTDDFIIRNNSFLTIEGGSNATGDDINLCRGGTISMSGGSLDNTTGSGIVRICTSEPAAATGNTEIIITGGTFDSTTSDTEGATTIDDFVTVSGGGTYTDDNGVLPVDLIFFEAHEIKNGILLKWATASEINNSHFEIQRSVDGQTFEGIGLVNGYGTTNEYHQYEFLDRVPKSVNYYRLRQVDYDGKFEVFHSIYAMFSQQLQYTIRTSNHDRAQVLIHMTGTPSVITIYTLMGTIMYLEEDKSELVVDTDSWTSGLYIIKMIWGQHSRTAKISIR